MRELALRLLPATPKRRRASTARGANFAAKQARRSLKVQRRLERISTLRVQYSNRFDAPTVSQQLIIALRYPPDIEESERNLIALSFLTFDSARQLLKTDAAVMVI
jgi:hypothetical protein